MTTLVLIFPAPAVPLSQNTALGNGWRKNRRLMDPWKWRTKQLLEAPENRRLLLEHREAPRPVTVRLTIPFRTSRRRDPHNYAPVVKAAVDGMVRAGYVPDDTAEWVTVLDPELVVGADLPAKVTITDIPDTLATIPRQA